MARFGRTGPILRPEPGSRPRPLFAAMRNIPWNQHFQTEIGGISVTQVDDNSVILIPTCDYVEDPFPYDPDDPDPLSPHSSDTTRVWKTTAVYEQIATTHPRIVQFRQRDPFMGFPILAKPSGPPLVDFLAKHQLEMYSAASSGKLPRILPQYLPLIYQWSLHLLSGLSFVNSHSIIFGDLHTEVCWLLSPSLSLSLVGFLDAGYLCRKRWVTYEGSSTRDEPFHPCHIPRMESVVATAQTDLFLWGCLVYELVTGFWPGRGQGKSTEEIQLMITNRKWPTLEKEFLGDIIKKCWEYDYLDIEDLKRNVISFLKHQGWEIEDGDNLKGFRADELFQDC